MRLFRANRTPLRLAACVLPHVLLAACAATPEDTSGRVLWLVEVVDVAGLSSYTDPRALIEEMDGLIGRGVVVGENLLISDRAQVIFPWHCELDANRESSAGEGKIGTTGRGIGPAYESKSARMGARIVDLLRPERLRALVEAGIAEHRRKWNGGRASW